jgi:hypothetical protein
VLEAQESNHYRLVSWSGDEAVIERQLEAASLQQINGKPRLVISGGGKAVFDRQAGVLKSLQWDLNFVSNEEYISRETKIVMTCRRIEPTGSSAAAVAKEDAAPALDPQQAVANLDSADLEQVLAALRVLQQANPNADRPAVVERLETFLDHADATVREAGAQAYAHWAGEGDVATLTRLVEDESTSVRRAAIEALGRLQATAAVDALAARLTVALDRAGAGRALTEIGPASEPVVLPYLDHAEWPLRLTAVHILRDVGGSNSLPRLEAMAEGDPQENVRTWAKLAVESVQERIAEQP